MSKQRATGFTLVELLVVAAIAVILVSITLPVFLNMRRTGRFNHCTQNLKEIGTALALYRADFGRYPAPPRADYLRYMEWQNLPYSTARTWKVADQLSASALRLTDATALTPGMVVTITPTATYTIESAPSSSSLELASVANLAEGMGVTLIDNESGNTERCTITGVLPGNNVITVEPELGNIYLQGGKLSVVLAGEKRAIASVSGDAVTFSQSLAKDYAQGGEVRMEPIRILGKSQDNQLHLERVTGLSAGMRVALYATKPSPAQPPSILEEPLITVVDAGTNTITLNVALQEHTYTGNEYLGWSVGNFGLATLYQLYLADERDYLRSMQRFHCPAVTNTESVDRGSILMQLLVSAPQLQSFHEFDPLFAGYNTYDLTYNYDQFDAEIKWFDQGMGYAAANSNAGRQLRNPNPSGDTVVCWCYGHGGGMTPNGRIANSVDAQLLENQLASVTNLVLWVDGSVAPIHPYLAETKDGEYYWVPPALYSRRDAMR